MTTRVASLISIDLSLRDHFFEVYSAAVEASYGKGHSKSTRGVKKGSKIDFRVGQARKATEKANAPNPLQASIDREVKKLGGR